MNNTYGVRQGFTSLKQRVPCHTRESAGLWVSHPGSELLHSSVWVACPEVSHVWSPQAKGDSGHPCPHMMQKVTRVFTIRLCWLRQQPLQVWARSIGLQWARASLSQQACPHLGASAGHASCQPRLLPNLSVSAFSKLNQ